MCWDMLAQHQVIVGNIFWAKMLSDAGLGDKYVVLPSPIVILARFLEIQTGCVYYSQIEHTA